MPAFKCVKSVFASVILFAGLGSNAAPFTNGNFEIINYTPIAPATSVALNTGDTWLTGWTVGGPCSGDVAVANGSADGLTPYAGQQLIVFNANNTTPGGSLSQTFDTTVGLYYTVAFAVGQVGSGNMSLTATAAATGNSFLASNYCVPTSGGWTLFQLTFIATTTNTTLVFTDTSLATMGVDAMLDDVTVTASEPAIPPSVVTSPVSQTANAGDTVVFTASAGGGPSTVQWYLINYAGTNAIAGATSTTLNFTASSTAPGNYFAVFSNTGGSATTSVATLTVLGLPFINGSFESISHTPIAPATSVALNTGDTWLTGWTVGGPGNGDVAVANGSADGLTPYAGQQLIVFNANDTTPGGSLSQTIDTTVGQYYTVTFAVGQVGSGNMSLTATAAATGNSFLASNYCVPTAGTWALFQLTFTATTSNTTLVFTDTSLATVGVDAMLDDVTVTASEPAIPPSVVTSPVSQTANPGDTVVFTASAGGGPSTVQWYLINYQGTNAVSGATSTTLNFTAGSTNAGEYFAVFSNTGGNVTTSVATLAVTGLPFINGSFESFNNAALASGTDVNFNNGDTWLTGWTVTVPYSGDVALASAPADGLNAYNGQYVILFNGGNTTPGGSLAQTFTTTVGLYYMVTFAVGQVGSGNMSLRATAAALDNSLLASNYCAAVQGSWTLFQFGFTAVSTNTTLVFQDASLGTFGVDVFLDDVTVVGEPTTGIPVVITSPVSQTANSGATVSFSASAAGSPSTLQWYLGANPVTSAGGTASPLVVTASDATAGSYTVVFTNSYGSATSAVAVLTVIDPPVIATSPASQVITANTEVTLTASASGSASTVQWYLGSKAISGATSANLTFWAVAASAGDYSAVFSNAAGKATSAVATLTVNAGPFTNGSFELINNHAAIAVNNGATLTPGSSWLTGWTVASPVNNDVAVINGTADGLSPYDGQQWVVFNSGYSTPGGSVSQTFITTVGQPCSVSFAVGERGTGSVSLTATAVALGGSLLASNYCVPTSGVWTMFHLAFTATSTNTTLVFKDSSLAAFSADIMLDDVTVISPPVIVTSPLSQTNLVGTTVTFTASASGAPLTVQWFQGSSPVLNATNDTLSFTANAGSGGNYTAVFSNAAGSATTAVAVLTVNLPVYLTQQPQSVTTNVGATVTFTGAAGGTDPLSLQWQFDGTDITGATATSLVLTNVQPANAGSYTLVVSNPYGTNTSTNAVLTLISAVQVGSATVAGAGTVTIPVNLIAIGNETVVTFSLDFDPAVLTFVGIAPGSGAAGVTFSSNTTSAVNGRIGVLAGSYTSAFSPGTQEIADVTFRAVFASKPTATTIGFGTSPTGQKIIDAEFDQLPGEYLAGTVTVTPTSVEGDVWPQPNGDYSLDANDWQQEGRFVAGLDTLVSNTPEFQRADCAPRGTSGDGVIDALDLAQVGRYVLGLDPPTPVGSLTGSGLARSLVKSKGLRANSGSDPVRTLSLVPMTNVANSVMVQLLAIGDENTVDFSLTFDPAILHFVSAAEGAGASGAMFIVNSKAAAAGQLGLVVAMPGGQGFAAGTDLIATVNFSPVCYANTVALAFADAPVVRSVADVTATVHLSATYQNGTLAEWPVLNIAPSGGNIVLSWPSSAANFTVQMTTNFSAAWSAAGGTPVTNNSTISVTLPAPTNTTFYRLFSQP
jgi:hypothetical protein